MTDRALAAARRVHGYALLRVAPNDVAAVPRITSLVAKLRGGQSAAIAYLRSSESAIARAFLAHYDNLLLPDWVHSALPIEAFCVAAHVSPTLLWKEIVAQYRTVNAELASIAVSESHPDLVDRMIEWAKGPDGDKDRLHLLRHMAFLPQPKGAQVSATFNVSANSAATAQAAALPAPPAEDTIRRLSDRFNVERGSPSTLEGETVGQPALPAASAAADPLAGLHRGSLDAMAPVLRQETVESAEDEP